MNNHNNDTLERQGTRKDVLGSKPTMNEWHATNFAKTRSMFERNSNNNNNNNEKENVGKKKTTEGKNCVINSDFIIIEEQPTSTNTMKKTIDDSNGTIIQLVELEGHFPSITDEAKHFFKRQIVESKQIALVTIAGQVGTGKSFLSECLTGRKGVFHVAHQTKSCTMGAQIGQLMPMKSFGVENDETLVGLIDLQGQGDGTVSRDINVSVPMLMISSVLIFNCPPGRPAKGDFLNRFAVMLECAKKIKPKTSKNVFGDLIVVFRDCNLDEKEIFTEFFEDEDEDDVDTHEESEACNSRNKMRKTIKKCFQRIEVVALPLPHHDAGKRGLTPGDELLPEFMQKLNSLKMLIGKCCISPKGLVGANGVDVPFTGSMIPTFLKNICDATRDPDLKLSPPDMMQALIAKLGEEAMVNLEKFANAIKVNSPLEDDALHLLLTKIVKEFNLVKDNEMEKSPIIKSDDFNQKCKDLLESKIVEITNKNSILMEKKIAEEKARMEALKKKVAEEKARQEGERAENEAKMKKLAEEKARREGKRADNEAIKKVEAESKAHAAHVKIREVVKQADIERKVMKKHMQNADNKVEQAKRIAQNAKQDNEKILRELDFVQAEAEHDKKIMNAKLNDMNSQVADAKSQVAHAKSIARQAQNDAAIDREKMNAKLDDMQSKLDDAKSQNNDHRGGGFGGGVIVMTRFGPMLMH